jgi:hypothetical protein
VVELDRVGLRLLLVLLLVRLGVCMLVVVKVRELSVHVAQPPWRMVNGDANLLAAFTDRRARPPNAVANEGFQCPKTNSGERSLGVH